MNKKNTILIIANGPSVLEHDFGQTIDQYPTIARINNYKISGYEKRIGNKTDIWFNGANQNLKKRKDIPPRVIVFIPPEILYRKGEAIHNRISKRLNISKEKYSLVPLEIMKEYEKQLGITRPTTGTSSILWALDNYQKVIIHGFDFFIDSKAHYNEKIINKWLIEIGINKKGEKHNMAIEKEHIWGTQFHPEKSQGSGLQVLSNFIATYGN